MIVRTSAMSQAMETTMIKKKMKFDYESAFLERGVYVLEVDGEARVLTEAEFWKQLRGDDRVEPVGCFYVRRTRRGRR